VVARRQAACASQYVRFPPPPTSSACVLGPVQPVGHATMRTIGLREVASIRRRELGDGAFRYDVTYRDPDGKQRMKTFRLKRSAVAFGNKMETDCGSTPT
jgi:hypothetical protein